MRNFRGLTKDGKMVYGWYVKAKTYSVIIPQGCHVYEFLSDGIEVIPESVAQQVGCKDKNKKEIYYGDKYKWYQPLVENGKQIRKEHISIVLDDIVELYYLRNRAENDWGGVEIIPPEVLEQPK